MHTEVSEFINTLSLEFKRHADPEKASEQKAYLQNKFDCYGLLTQQRRNIQKPFLVREFLPPKDQLKPIVKQLLEKPQREYHYFAQELTLKYVKHMNAKDIQLFEYMICHKSWWDTVDFIATKLVGHYFKVFSGEKNKYISKWLSTDHMWLHRTALIFQLKYKEDIDTVLLSQVINAMLGSKAFFINKAIGWVLREYSRTNPDWVVDFVDNTNLNPLSKREALRLIK